MAFATAKSGAQVASTSTVSQSTITDYATWSYQKLNRLETLVSNLEDLYGHIQGQGESKSDADPAQDVPYGVTNILFSNENRFSELNGRLEDVIINLKTIVGN